MTHDHKKALLEEYEERVAIMHCDGGVRSVAQAERLALADIAKRHNMTTAQLAMNLREAKT